MSKKVGGVAQDPPENEKIDASSELGSSMAYLRPWPIHNKNKVFQARLIATPSCKMMMI